MAFSGKAKGRQSTSVQRLGEGVDVFLRALRDGSLITADWKHAAIMGGFGHMINEGALTTGQVGGGETNVILIRQPEALVSIPNGTCILPIRVDVAVHPGAFASGADECEILIACDQDAAYAGDGTCDSIGIYNINSLSGKISACTAVVGCSANITTPVHDLELAHAVSTADTDGTEANFVWHGLNLVYEPRNPIILNGPAMLAVHFGGTVATSGFISVQWLEFPETAFRI